MKRIVGKGIQDQEVGNNASELNYVTKQVVKLYECCVLVILISVILIMLFRYSSLAF
ncbi:hypothetical protein ANAPC1_00073 [Anaplasma phagocytophilum]|uniref:Uncharacterized protein n=1 Tax=Anaplasma phagocytophilum TaxID=948 RepID=A0AA45ZH06_ANAPH|nr:hypothetical protein [Anaplasma phagocytophilum]SBO13739.1 hypothetical protein ANAPC1_00073 [Anaplasma phagocytophilum]